MILSGHTILITGGGSGIGLALTERFLRAGSEVIICGRREDKLKEAKLKYPKLHIRICDLVKEVDRIALFNWVTKEFPAMDILINNAGIQRRIQLIENKDDWKEFHQEIAINMEAPIHLSTLFIPHFQKKKEAFIINITSGLAFTPAAWVPVYSATKAALHSFTMTLRHQLSKTGIKVIEVAPPAVQTDLGGAGLHTFGVPVDEFADAVMQNLEKGEMEFGYGTSEKARIASSAERNEIFIKLHSR
jgi:uncharacterized oxidoreductase